LPSWQANSKIGSRSFITSGIANVHGFVHVERSSTVTGRTETPQRVRRHRRHLSVGGIDDEPRQAALRDVERIAELQRTDGFRTREHLPVSRGQHGGELRSRHLVAPASREFVRPLERRALLVLVGVVALQIRIAPGVRGAL
jgi:hypothetical protein